MNTSYPCFKALSLHSAATFHWLSKARLTPSPATAHRRHARPLTWDFGFLCSRPCGRVQLPLKGHPDIKVSSTVKEAGLDCRPVGFPLIPSFHTSSCPALSTYIYIYIYTALAREDYSSFLRRSRYRSGASNNWFGAREKATMRGSWCFMTLWSMVAVLGGKD